MNKIYTHPGQAQMQVEVILASRNAAMPDEKPLVTLRMRYPRPIHGELMTHRMFSRNARSSRAVPVKTMLDEVRNAPFVPWHWGLNQKGMQADEECNTKVAIRFDSPPHHFEHTREYAWLTVKDYVADQAESFMNAGYHKQIVNRLLEPFSWIDTLITSNRWDNFLWLRDHKDAEPHLQDLARLVKQALDEAVAYELWPGHWHLPYITEEDLEQTRYMSTSVAWEWLRKISAARCARISYKPFDGDSSYEAELRRYDQLVTSDRVHASPTEHQATPDTKELRDFLPVSKTDKKPIETVEFWMHPELHGNLPGWIQARKLIPNECYRG